MDKGLGAGDPKNAGHHSGTVSGEASSPEGEQTGGQSGTEDGGQSYRHFGDPQKRNTSSLEPVDKRGFVEAVLAIQMGHHPVASFEHLPGGFCKTRFIPVHQRQQPRSGAETAQSHREQDHPAPSGPLTVFSRGPD